MPPSGKQPEESESAHDATAGSTTLKYRRDYANQSVHAGNWTEIEYVVDTC